MNISPLMRKLLVRGGYMDKTDDGTGGSGGGGGSGGNEGEKKTSDGGEQKPPVDDKALREAREALDRANADLADTKAKLATFDGIDPAAVRKLLDAQRAQEEEALAKRGEWDALKQQMVDAHGNELTAERAKTTAASEALTKAQAQISELTVGAAFSSSKFVSEKLNMPAGKVRALFGAHFSYEGDRVVGFNKPVGAEGRAKLVDGRGEPLSFELAMEALVNADPDKDDLLKPSMKPGASSGSGSHNNGGPAADTAGLSGVSRIKAALAAKR